MTTANANRLAQSSRHWRHRRFPLRACLGALLVAGFSGASACGQFRPPKLAEPEEIALESKDGVQLAATYFGSLQGKKAVPILMLHGWKGNRSRYESFARSLQQAGHAVLTLDFRGHGASKRHRNGATIDVDRMGRREIAAMVLDVEAAKKYLMDKHNQGQLNIELLCVVAEEMAGIIAMNWSVIDWNTPSLPTLKQGQDVKALVLLSPVQSFQGLTSRLIFTQRSRGAVAVRSMLSIMIAAGQEDAAAFGEASRLYASFKKYRGEPAEDAKERDLVFRTPSTNLQGAKLISTQGLTIPKDISLFIDFRVGRLQDRFPWQDRSNPLGG